MKQSEAYMTSPIGDLPINSEGLRKAVDEIARLNFYIHSLEERDKITQDAVVSLKENNAKLIKQNNKFNLVRKGAVKEFAEKIISCMQDREYQGIAYKQCVFSDRDIEELLKEYGVEL